MIELKTILQQINEEDQPDKSPSICYYPGGFKPPHEGHYEVVKDLASRPDVTKVIVLVGHSERDGITKEMSKKIWDLYLQIQPMSQVTVRIAENPSPIKDIFTIMDDDLELRARVAGVAGEADVQSYFNSLTKAFGDRVITIPVEEKAVTQGKRASGTQTREYITQLKKSVLKLRSISDKNSTEYSKARNEYLNTYKIVQGCFPDFVTQKGKFDEILNILGIPVLSEEDLQENIFSVNWWKIQLKEVNDNGDVIQDFIDFAVNTLELQQTPKINFIDDGELARNLHSLGAYNPKTDELLVVRGSRLTADILRTLAHELVHRKQDELGMLEPDSGKTGSPIENEANAAAGILLRQFGQYRPEIFETLKESKYTLNDKQKEFIKYFIDRNYKRLGNFDNGTEEYIQRTKANITASELQDLITQGVLSVKTVSDAKGNTEKALYLRANPKGLMLEDDEKKQYKIYCDMDGVLVDFDRAYFELTGEKASFNTDPDKFWEPITKAGAAFWIKMQWMPDGKELWNFIKPYNPSLLSAPSREESSKIGKFTWVKRNVPGTKLILRSAERKQEFATPNSILIDDRADNIQRWNDAGGIGIHHTSAESTIKQLKDLGL